MEKRFVRNRNTWVAYILLMLYGYFLNILGPITPFLHDEFHLSYTVTSLHFSAFAIGILVVGFLGTPVIRRVGRWQALSLGACGLGIGALLLVWGRIPVITVGATFLMGCVGSLILAVVPVALAAEHGERRGVALSEANALSSLVAALAPLLVGWFAGWGVGWRLALIVAALASILAGAILFRPARNRGVVFQAEAPSRRLPPRFWFYWIALVLAVSVEFCMIYWSADYMESALNLPRASAAQTVSLFLGGMILGRWMGSRLLRVLSARRVILASLLVGILGFLLYWSASSAWVGMVSLAITGLGVASLYPLLVSIAIGAAHGEQAQAGARMTLASGAAVLLLPLALGRLADIAGLKMAFSIVAVLFAAMFLMMILEPKIVPEKQARFPDQQPTPPA